MRETHLRMERQTVKLGLAKVVHDLFPDDSLKTSYSILEGVFCNLAGSVMSPREVKAVDERLREWVASGGDIRLLGRHGGYYRYQVGDLVVDAVYPANEDASRVEPFALIPYSYGFIVDFGDIDKGNGSPLIPPVHLSAAYENNQLWLGKIDVETSADVNLWIEQGRSLRLISIAEALHEKQLADIADQILAQRRALRVLLIAGPSSSGKSSTAQRLATQLQVNGFKPVSLSLDNYFLDRAVSPRDAEGNFDFDTIDALNLPLLRDHLSRLVDGEAVETPIFDFERGAPDEQTIPMVVGNDQVLLIEGIHALNPAITGHLPTAQLFKLYVSALGGLNIDLMNRVPTTEIRLLRRIVRDNRYRGTMPADTIRQWASVRRGEYNHIFRYQEEADMMFNSSLMYEMNALRPLADECLATIPDDSEFAATRDRLLNLLTFFDPVDSKGIPCNSILREFIGDSIYTDPDWT